MSNIGTILLNKELTKQLVTLVEIISLFDFLDYKKLDLQSPYYYKSRKRNCDFFCVKCFVDHKKFVKKNSLKKFLHHIDTKHQIDCFDNPTSKQIKRLMEIFSIKLQIDEFNLKNNFTKKQQYQIEKIDSILLDLKILRKSK